MGRSRHAYDASDGPPPDVAVAELAARQHGVVSRAQLIELGLSRTAIHRRVERGRLHRLHRCVFAVGHSAISPRGRWLAAALACGPAAVLSLRDAGALWGFRPSARRLIDVTTPDRGRAGPPGIDLHRVRSLPAADVTRRDGIPVTTVARTLVDLADVLADDALQKAVHETEVLRLFDLRAIEASLGRANGRHGAARLRALLEVPLPPTRSELERRFLALCAEHGLPLPKVNRLVEVAGRTIEVDFLWPERRLVVETDGAATHRTRRAFEEDPRRDADLVVAGFRVVRFTWRRVTKDAAGVAGVLGALVTGPP